MLVHDWIDNRGDLLVRVPSNETTSNMLNIDLSNTVIFKHLPLMEGIVVIVHIFGFLAIVIVLLVMGPRGGSETVTTFSSNGWPSAGLSCLVGILSPIITLVGADSQCHLSEELYNAAWVLPRAMVATATANYIMGFIMGTDLERWASRSPLIMKVQSSPSCSP